VAANVFGTTNTVTAGPGPFAAAWTVLKDNQIVTKAGFGIAINSFCIGGAAATSGQSSTATTATAVPNPTSNRAK
jgi:hypothetical protein